MSKSKLKAKDKYHLKVLIKLLNDSLWARHVLCTRFGQHAELVWETGEITPATKLNEYVKLSKFRIKGGRSGKIKQTSR